MIYLITLILGVLIGLADLGLSIVAYKNQRKIIKDIKSRGKNIKIICDGKEPGYVKLPG